MKPIVLPFDDNHNCHSRSFKSLW